MFAKTEVRVRCSSCEPLLDQYVEGTLAPQTMLAVRAHLSSCASCRSLLHDLKAVDGLLFTTRVPSLPENFTFAVMAEVCSQPLPRARQHPVWSFLTLYCAAAWVAVIAGIVLMGTSRVWVFDAGSSALTRLGLVSSGFSASISQGFAHAIPGLAAFGFGVLIIDIVIAAAFAALYLLVRPRLAAQIASAPEAFS